MKNNFDATIKPSDGNNLTEEEKELIAAHAKVRPRISDTLDSSWKYTTKVNIHSGERLVRELLYRQGASDFQKKTLQILEASDDVPEYIVDAIKNLKS